MHLASIVLFCRIVLGSTPFDLLLRVGTEPEEEVLLCDTRRRHTWDKGSGSEEDKEGSRQPRANMGHLPRETWQRECCGWVNENEMVLLVRQEVLDTHYSPQSSFPRLAAPGYPASVLSPVELMNEAHKKPLAFGSAGTHYSPQTSFPRLAAPGYPASVRLSVLSPVESLWLSRSQSAMSLIWASLGVTPSSQ